MKRVWQNIAGIVIQSIYWTAFCSIYSYATVYLQKLSFSSSQVGLIIALASFIAVIIQPMIGAWTDKGHAIRLRTAALTIVIITGLTSALMIFYEVNHTVIMALYLIELLGIISTMPLLNAMIIRLTDAGGKVGFGVARAFGSLAFALGSSGLGLLIDQSSASVLPMVSVVLLSLLAVAIFAFPQSVVTKQQGAVKQQVAVKQSSDNAQNTFFDFIKRYPGFLFVITGLALVFVFHTISNVFLVKIIEANGGTEKQFGFALTLMASVEIPTMIFSGALIKKFGTKHLFMFAMVFYVARSTALFLSKDMMGIYFAQILQAFSFALYIPISVAYVNDRMAIFDKVKGQTMIVSATTLGGVLGSIVGGRVIDQYGIREVLLLGLTSVSIGAVLVIIGLIRNGRSTGAQQEIKV